MVSVLLLRVLQRIGGLGIADEGVGPTSPNHLCWQSPLGEVLLSRSITLHPSPFIFLFWAYLGKFPYYSQTQTYLGYIWENAYFFLILFSSAQPKPPQSWQMPLQTAQLAYQHRTAPVKSHPTFCSITFPASLLASVARFPTDRSSCSNTGLIWSRILQRCEPSSPIDNHADNRYRHSS